MNLVVSLGFLPSSTLERRRTDMSALENTYNNVLVYVYVQTPTSSGSVKKINSFLPTQIRHTDPYFSHISENVSRTPAQKVYKFNSTPTYFLQKWDYWKNRLMWALDWFLSGDFQNFWLDNDSDGLYDFKDWIMTLLRWRLVFQKDPSQLFKLYFFFHCPPST